MGFFWVVGSPVSQLSRSAYNPYFERPISRRCVTHFHVGVVCGSLGEKHCFKGSQCFSQVLWVDLFDLFVTRDSLGLPGIHLEATRWLDLQRSIDAAACGSSGWTPPKLAAPSKGCQLIPKMVQPQKLAHFGYGKATLGGCWPVVFLSIHQTRGTPNTKRLSSGT